MRALSSSSDVTYISSATCSSSISSSCSSQTPISSSHPSSSSSCPSSQSSSSCPSSQTSSSSTQKIIKIRKNNKIYIKDANEGKGILALDCCSSSSSSSSSSSESRSPYKQKFYLDKPSVSSSAEYLPVIKVKKQKPCKLPFPPNIRPTCPVTPWSTAPSCPVRGSNVYMYGI